MLTEENRARDALAKIPNVTGETGPLIRMGGLTNIVFQAGQYVLRLPGDGTEEYIDRANEAAAAKEAARAAVGPEVVYADPDTGVMVTRFVANAATMTPEGFRNRAGSPARAGEALARLHRSGAKFPAKFELFAMIEDYLRILSTKAVALPAGYHDVVKEANAVRQALDRNPVPTVACHCDPLCENFLDTADRMWVVDWEYSGMNDPMWDLGDLSVEGEFDDTQDSEMLTAYFGGEPPAQEHARMVIYKAMCDLLWTLWGLIQLANNNSAGDFRAYADSRFARCNALMATPEFMRQLKVLSGS
ncbi:MAG: phosphotransferase family protein [Sedimentitalea sp.]|uniref:phosphotransferase family protein n=1 Tax=Sedimentitalea sp. TaxID=2048915 RepID=UPI00326331FA